MGVELSNPIHRWLVVQNHLPPCPPEQPPSHQFRNTDLSQRFLVVDGDGYAPEVHDVMGLI